MNLFETQLTKHRNSLFYLLTYVKEKVPHCMNLDDDVTKYLVDYDSWINIPIIEKSDIQKDWVRFVEDENIVNDPKVSIHHTSGSSGTPLRILKNLSTEMYVTKKMWKVRQTWAKDIMNWKLLYLYRNLESKYQKVLRIGTHDDYLDLSEASLASYMKDILKFEPDWLIGPPIATLRLVHYCKDQGITISSIKLVELFGEMLLPHQREIIESVFSCKVINHYGCREFGILSYECPAGLMHAWDEKLFFEVLKNGKPVKEGEVGDLVVTSLSNYAMPLIRYALGDLVKLTTIEEPCDCNNESNLLLTPVGGRLSHLVYTEKKIISSGVFDTLFSRFIRKHPDFIKEFQVIQEKVGSFNIKIVRGSAYDSSTITILEKQFKEYLDDSKITFILVDEIKSSASGKTPTFIPMKKEGVR